MAHVWENGLSHSPAGDEEWLISHKDLVGQVSLNKLNHILEEF